MRLSRVVNAVLGATGTSTVRGILPFGPSRVLLYTPNQHVVRGCIKRGFFEARTHLCLIELKLFVHALEKKKNPDLSSLCFL